MDWVRKGLFETQLFRPKERVSISQLLGSKVAWQGRKHEVRLQMQSGHRPLQQRLKRIQNGTWS
jgi:hypothetical protein